MATKYLIFGAAFNGDGTTSSEAASNGAAGAWNQSSILTGTAPTYGALAAGDTVNIRSKTGAGADADISNTLGASITLGSASATATAPITWILDDGAIWAGKNGTLTYTTNTAAYTYTFRDFNRFVALTPLNWVFENTASGSAVWTHGAGDYHGLLFNRPSTSSGGYSFLTSSRFYGCKFNYGVLNTSQGAVRSVGGVRSQLFGCEISIATVGGAVFHPGGQLQIIGGALTGAGATTGTYVAMGATTGGDTELIGFQISKNVAPISGSIAGGTARISMFGCDGGPGSAVYASWGQADCRNITNNYPTLNAVNPDSAGTPVSWRVYPSDVTSYDPATLTIDKAYKLAAAAKTVTLEFLLANPWGGTGFNVANASTIWMEVSYIDNATGAMKQLTTRDWSAGALTSSTAPWSGTSWGMVNFAKCKLAVLTPTSIKQDTPIVVRFYCAAKSSSSSDVIVVDPDVQLS